MIRRIGLLAALVVFGFANPIFCDPELEVTGILLEDRPLAIVNGKIVEEGQDINGAKIVKIGEDFVLFRIKDKDLLRRIGSESARKEYAAENAKKQPAPPPPKKTRTDAGLTLIKNILYCFLLGWTVLLGFALAAPMPPSADNLPAQYHPGVDKGFSWKYRSLSYRRKLIRTLFVAISLSLFFFLSNIAQMINPAAAAAISLLLSVLAGYNFWQWRKDLKTTNLRESSAESSR